MTFHVYNGDRYLGLVIGDTEEQAASQARSNWGGSVQLVQVLYRPEPDIAQYIVDQYEP